MFSMVSLVCLNYGVTHGSRPTA